MTRSEFSKWSGSRVVCISFAPGEEESFGNSRRAPASLQRAEVFSITRKLWVPNGRFSTSGWRKRRVKPNFCRIEDSGQKSTGYMFSQELLETAGIYGAYIKSI